MVRTRLALLALLLAGCVSACGSSAAQAKRSAGHTATAERKARGTGGLKTVGLMSGGHRRTYLLYVPPGDSTRHSLPLVLAFHGVDDTARHTATETGLLRLDQHSHAMILVFPQGYQDTWNEGAGHTPAERAGINDVAFSATILRRVESHYVVDPHRVVATGFSNGALLTEYLGCTLSRQLTLIAPVEGQLPASVSANCDPPEPVNVYEVHATADQAIPYAGGHFDGIGGGTTVLSAPDSAMRWAALDHCSGHPGSSATGALTLSSYGGCADSVRVTLATIDGGKHAWPQGFGATLAGVVSSLPGTRTAIR